VNVTRSDRGFAAALVVDRCQESLRQLVLLASLPDGRVLSWERFVANADLALESLDQGLLQITNETFPLLGSKARGMRTLYHPGGKSDYKGWLGESLNDDLVSRLGRPAWLNVDDRMGIRFTGPGAAVYHNRHYHRPYRAVADDLVLSRLESQPAFRAGEAMAPLAALLIPEQNHADTPQAEFHVLQGPDQTACLATRGYVAAANFTTAEGVFRFRRRRPELIDAHAGTSIEVRGDDLEVRIPLSGRSAQWFEAATVLRANGDVGLDASTTGAIYAINLGKRLASVEVVEPVEARRKESLRPGEARMLFQPRGG
jgi:hypothetical protein